MLSCRPLLPWQRKFGKFGLLFHKNRFFFFLCRWNRAFLAHHFSVWHSTKRCFSISDLGPLTPKIEYRKCYTKSPISRIVWHTDGRCLHLPGGFRRWPIQRNHAKCGADPCCHGNENLANLGYFFTTSHTSRLVCQTDQTCLGPTRGPVQNIVRGRRLLPWQRNLGYYRKKIAHNSAAAAEFDSYKLEIWHTHTGAYEHPEKNAIDVAANGILTFNI